MNNRIKNVVQTVLISSMILCISVICLVSPSKDFSDSERRKLAQFPELSFSSFSSGRFMSLFEDYALDQFPARDFFRSIKAYTSKYIFYQKSNNNIYVSDGIACKIEYPMREDSIEYASNKFRYLYESHLKNVSCNIFLSVIPDKNAFFAKENGQLSFDYSYFISQIESKNNFARFIHIENLLQGDDFYATDTHWKQENTIDIAKALANAMGTEIAQDFIANETYTDFHGVYSGQSALPLKPDTIRYLTSDLLKNCTVYDHQNDKEIPLYDFKKLNDKDPYEMYLGGSLSLVTVQNPDALSDKKLIIFRDSFASSIAPILSTAYAHITLIDIRYLPSQQLSKHVDFEDCDVLFLYSTSVLNNSNTLK